MDDATDRDRKQIEDRLTGALTDIAHRAVSIPIGLEHAVAIAHGGDQNIKTDERSSDVARAGNKPDQRVQTEFPTDARHAKQAVHVTRQLIETFFNFNTLRLHRVARRLWL